MSRDTNARTRVLFAGVCALILTVGLARFAYTPLLPLMREQAGLTYLGGGWLATFNYLGYLGGALLAALISDLGLKFRLYRLGLVLALLSTAAMGLTTDVRLWALLRFIAGFSSIAGLLLASGLVLNWLMRQGHRPQLGLHFSGLGLGIVVSGLAVVAMLSVPLDWAAQWLGLGLFGLVFFIPAWFWLPAPARVAAQPPQGHRPTPSKGWLWLLIAGYFCGGVGYVVSATFIVSIVEKLPLFAGHGAWVWVLVGLAAAPAAFIWDWVAHRVGELSALLLAYALQLLSCLLPLLSTAALANLSSAALYGVTFVGIVSLTLTLIGRCYPENPAKAMARLTLSFGVAQILAPALAGFLAEASGTYLGSLGIAAGALGVGMGLLLAMQRLERAELQSAG